MSRAIFSTIALALVGTFFLIITCAPPPKPDVDANDAEFSIGLPPNSAAQDTVGHTVTFQITQTMVGWQDSVVVVVSNTVGSLIDTTVRLSGLTSNVVTFQVVFHTAGAKTVSATAYYLDGVTKAGEVGFYVIALADTTPPTLEITAPADSDTVHVTSVPVTVTGSAEDVSGIKRVEYVAVQGSSRDSGLADGTETWTIDSLDLDTGATKIIIRAVDSADNAIADSVVLIYRWSSQVDKPVVIVSQPTDTQALINTEVLFAIRATGDTPLIFAWRRGSTVLSISDSTYTIALAQTTDSGTYTCKVTDADGDSAACIPWHLEVATSLVPPGITTQPADHSVEVGDSAMFSVSASGTAPLRYQWFKDSDSIPGATQATYGIDSVTVADTGDYLVKVCNSKSCVTSDSAHLSVQPTVEFAIAVSAGAHGSITPAGTGGLVTVARGATQSFTIVPDSGYVISQVLVDGSANAEAESTGVFSFSAVAANHTISATFSPALTVSVNTGLSLSEGASRVISDSTLKVVPRGTTSASTIVFSLAEGPHHGTLKCTTVAVAAGGTFTQADINARSISYTHDGSEAFTDSIAVTVSDGSGGRIGRIVYAITVTPANDTPTLETNGGLTVAEGGTAAVSASVLEVTDADNTPLQIIYVLVMPPVNGALKRGTTVLNADSNFTQDDINNGRISYSETTALAAADSFTFTVSDGNGGSIAANRFRVTVSSVNHTPVARDSSFTVNEDDTLSVTLPASDVDNNLSSCTVTYGPLHGSLTGSNATRTYQPDADYYGQDTIRFRAVDNGSLTSNTATIVIAVTSVNDTPTTGNQSVATGEDTPLSITLSAADVDDNTLTWSLVTGQGPEHGILSGTAPDLVYTPTLNYNGADQFRYQVSDGQAAAVSTISITVSPVNDPPSINTTADSVATTYELYQYAVTTTDPEDNSIVWSLTTAPSGMTISTSGAISWTPTDTNVSSVSVTVRATDNGTPAQSATQSFTIAVNRPPIFDNASPMTSTGIANVYTFSAACHDKDGDAIQSVSAVTIPPGAAFTGTTFLWRPGWETTIGGSYPVSLRATDSKGAVSTLSWNITLGAHSWRKIAMATPPASAQNLIAAVDSNRIFLGKTVVGSVYMSQNGGSTWATNATERWDGNDIQTVGESVIVFGSQLLKCGMQVLNSSGTETAYQEYPGYETTSGPTMGFSRGLKMRRADLVPLAIVYSGKAPFGSQCGLTQIKILKNWAKVDSLYGTILEVSDPTLDITSPPQDSSVIYWTRNDGICTRLVSGEAAVPIVIPIGVTNIENDQNNGDTLFLTSRGNWIKRCVNPRSSSPLVEDITLSSTVSGTVVKSGSLIWCYGGVSSYPKLYFTQTGFSGATPYYDATGLSALLGQNAIVDIALAEDGVTLFVLDDEGNIYR